MPTRPLLSLPLLSSLALALGVTAMAAPAGTARPEGPEPRELAYGEHPAHRLDLYRPADTPANEAPIMVYVHGGGWRKGDKSAVGEKAAHIFALMRSRSARFYGRVFGDDPAVWKDASPARHVEPGAGIPPFLIGYSSGLRGNAGARRAARAEAFAETLRDAGIAAVIVDASDRNHRQINVRFGRSDDEKVTGRAMAFLEAIRAEE